MPIAIKVEHCPKCQSRLFAKNAKEYFCIHCGMEGTPKEMQDKMEAIKQIFNESIATCKCSFCGKTKKVYVLHQITLQEKVRYICDACSQNKPIKTLVNSKPLN